jgi:hypothetical protein
MKYSIYLIFIVFAVFLVNFQTVAAQGPGSSVVIVNDSKPGSNDAETADIVGQNIIKGLEEKYPCIDWMNEQTLHDEIQKLREKETLTGKLDEKALAELGNAVGADFIMIVRVYTMPNGQTAVFVQVVDGRTAKQVANQMVTTDAGNSAAAAQTVAQKILQDMAGPFRGQCDDHWVGTITYTQKTFKEKTETTEITKINKIEAFLSEDYEYKTEVALQPVSKGSKINYFTNGNQSMTMSRVHRKFKNHYERRTTETGEEACRQRGANPYRKQFTSIDKKIIDENGENTETLPVEITVFRDTNRFTAKVATPGLTIKRTEEWNGVRDFCVPQPFNEPKSSEKTDTASFFSFEGQLDPKNPDVLVGKTVTGTLETRQYITTWNLHLVRLKKKGQK